MAGDAYLGSYGTLITTRVKVLSWNIWWRFGPWEARQSAIEKTIAHCKPDLVALQEVWAQGDQNQAEILANALGMAFRFESHIERDGVRFGNAILSRWPIARCEARGLPALEETDEGRLVLLADVDGPRGGLRICSTHLNYRLHHGHVRQAQVREIATFIASQDKLDFPTVLCGDFNAQPQSDEIRMLTGHAQTAAPGLAFREAWLDGGDGGNGYTWDDRNPFVAAELEPNMRIDHILVGEPGPGGAGHVASCRVIGDEPVDGVWPSDHFGLLAEVRY